MFPWQDVFTVIISRVIGMYFDPALWVIMALVAVQYWQMQRSQKKMFGVASYSLRYQVLLAAGYGAIGGVLGSMLLTVVGITVNELGLNYIWPVAIVLMMINMRLLCFAYAGGLVALANVLLGWPVVNVPQLLALVAVLHITESILIAISRRYGASPLFLKRADGQVVGAFSLQNFWPLPLILLAVVAVPDGAVPGGVIKMPEWWPLVPAGLTIPEGEPWVYTVMPVVAALGYADIAVASSPHKRRLESAVHLGIYSVALLILAWLSVKVAWLKVFAAIAAPLGHEVLIQMDNKRELAGTPRYIQPDCGVMILDTVEDSPARKAGLQPGDIMLRLNNRLIGTRSDLGWALLDVPPRFWLEFEREGKLTKRLIDGKGDKTLGVILVPDGSEQYYAEITTDRFGVFDWIKRKLGR